MAKWLIPALLIALAPAGQSLSPYVSTPEDVVEADALAAEVKPSDVVYDLGCGDGRIRSQPRGSTGLAARESTSIRGGSTSRARTRKPRGVEHLVEFRLEDVMTADVSRATVVTSYLLSSSNAKLRPLLTRQLRPGARIVSHAFSTGPEWPADEIDHFTSARGDEVTLYSWKVDGKPR